MHLREISDNGTVELKAVARVRPVVRQTIGRANAVNLTLQRSTDGGAVISLPIQV